MITMEAPSDEQTERDWACLARIEADETKLRPLYRRALQRARDKRDSGQSFSIKEREILTRIAAL